MARVKLTEEEKKERQRNVQKEWRKKHPEKLKEYQKKWRDNNKEKVAAYNKKWRSENKEAWNKIVNTYRNKKQDPYVDLTTFIHNNINEDILSNLGYTKISLIAEYDKVQKLHINPVLIVDENRIKGYQDIETFLKKLIEND